MILPVILFLSIILFLLVFKNKIKFKILQNRLKKQFDGSIYITRDMYNIPIIYEYISKDLIKSYHINFRLRYFDCKDKNRRENSFKINLEIIEKDIDILDLNSIESFFGKVSDKYSFCNLSHVSAIKTLIASNITELVKQGVSTMLNHDINGKIFSSKLVDELYQINCEKSDEIYEVKIDKSNDIKISKVSDSGYVKFEDYKYTKAHISWGRSLNFHDVIKGFCYEQANIFYNKIIAE